MVVYTYNLNTEEAKAGGSWVQSQPGLHRRTLSQKIKANQPNSDDNNNNKTKTVRKHEKKKRERKKKQ
jgi:hypothetical protein